MSERHRALRGTKDILPEEALSWQYLEATTREVFARFCFREVRTPLLEPTALFTRSVGATTDIVHKEMYTFEIGGESVSLRPEATASVVRAFVEHSLHRHIAAGYPERYYYLGPMFRHERPQKGRQRQFHQIGAEVLGAAEATVDAETIGMALALLDALGLARRELALNSVGDACCRPQFRARLAGWLAVHGERLCDDCRRRQHENPLRVFDCKVAGDRELLQGAPTVLETLCAGCAAHFAEVQRLLAEAGITARVDPRIVRGLDYYSRTVFEVLSADLGAQNAILGGGRYDGLVAELGGPATPAFGFSIGMERLILLLDPRRVPRAGIDVVLVAVGEPARHKTRRLAARLRGEGLSCVLPSADRPLGAQLRRADRLGARFALLVGEDELRGAEVSLKDLASGEQVRIDEAAIAARVREVADDGR
jgi:histidyl-tRNA synthetase